VKNNGVLMEMCTVVVVAAAAAAVTQCEGDIAINNK